MIRTIVRDELRAALAELGTRDERQNDPEYVDDRRLAEILGLSRRALQQMRWRAAGPPFVKTGRRSVRYHLQTARAWMACHTRGRAV